MIRNLKAVAAAFASISLGGAANAAINLDQQNTHSNNQFEALSFGQSFTANITGQLTSIVFEQQTYFNGRNSGNGTISVYSGNGTGGTLLGSATMGGTTSGSGTFTNVIFDLSALNVFLTSGSQYTFVAARTSGLLYTLMFDQYDQYSGGSMQPSGSYPAYYDMKFATYVDGEPSAVPEPATWAMMLMGFGLIGHTMRSRRKVAVRFN